MAGLQLPRNVVIPAEEEPKHDLPDDDDPGMDVAPGNHNSGEPNLESDSN